MTAPCGHSPSVRPSYLITGRANGPIVASWLAFNARLRQIKNCANAPDTRRDCGRARAETAAGQEPVPGPELGQGLRDEWVRDELG